MSCNGLEWIQPPSNESRLPGCYAYYDPPARIVDELNRLVDRNKRLEDRIDLLMSANADVARIAGERYKAEKRVLYLESALREIANQDYRGSRSTESQIAFRALEDKL
jgi:hypothetical protein